MELTVKDRLVIQDLIPKGSNKTTAFVLWDISEKIKITNQEAKRINLRALPDSSFLWDEKKAKIMKTDFSEAEKQTIRSIIERADKEQTVSIYYVETIKKFSV